MKRYNSNFLAVLLAGCGGDSVQDKNLDEAMSREAMCVAASERFFYTETLRVIWSMVLMRDDFVLNEEACRTISWSSL